jgi:CrcB protein
MTRTHPVEHLEAIVVVGIGGFAGSNLRYLVDLTLPSSLAATLAVNVVGCFALGVLVYEELFSATISGTSRTLVATGFIASFTTYSTFIVDTLTTSPVSATGYVATSYVSGFVAVLLGREAARWITDITPPGQETGD